MIDDIPPMLRLDQLHDRHSGLTAAVSGTYHEAAVVCLARHHESPVELDVECSRGRNRRCIQFEPPTDRMLNAHANVTDATEAGAYGISLAALESEEELVAVRRAETLTGADWYVAPPGVDANDLEHCYRLEVSGTDAGGTTTIAARLRQKIEQTRRGASNLPAIASVVGFKELLVAIQKVSDGA